MNAFASRLRPETSEGDTTRPTWRLGRSVRSTGRSRSVDCMVLPSASCAGTALRAGLDVLVHVEDVVRVVARLDLREPLVVVGVRGPHPALPLVHHEVDVGAAGGVP